jgi:hypothetical protein
MEPNMTPEEYKKVKEDINQYEMEINKSLIPKMVCICCYNTQIKPLEGYGLDYGAISPSKMDEGMWNNGTVVKVHPGYGSKFDGFSFFAAICDECVEKLFNQKLIISDRDIRKQQKEL